MDRTVTAPSTDGNPLSQLRRIMSRWPRAEVQRRARALAAGLREDLRHGAPPFEVAAMLEVLAAEVLEAEVRS